MAVVTGLTAARMLAIEAATIVGAAVDGSGHLILTRHDASTFDGGVIVGPNAVDIYNTQTVGGQKTFSDKMQINNILVVGAGGLGSTPIAGSNSSPSKAPVAEFYKDTGASGEEANLVIRGNSAGTGGSVAGGRGVGILLKHSTEASTTESNKHWAITAYSTLAYGNSPNLIFRNGNTGVNPLILDGVTNAGTFAANLSILGYTFTIGNSGTGVNPANLILNGGDAGASGGGGGIYWYKNSVLKLSLYTLGSDGNLYVRDNVNSKMIASFKPGGAGASSVDITDKLTIGTTSISASAGLVGATAGGNVDDIISWSVADNDGFRIRVGGASNAGYVEFATNDDAAEQIYFRQYSPGWTTAVRTLTLLDSAGDTTVPGMLSASRIAVGYDGGSGIGTSGWFRSSGATGWYNASYNTGIYSNAAGWIETYASANFRVNGILAATTIDLTDDIGDRVMLYGAVNASTAYGIGIESSTMYYKAAGIHRWYISANADGGTSEKLKLDGSAFYTDSTVEFVSRAQQIRVRGSILRDDGTYFYLLLGTDSVPGSNWNTIRPFHVRKSDGMVWMPATVSLTTSTAGNMFINTTAGNLARSTASSIRWKNSVALLGSNAPELDPMRILDIPVREFKFNADHLGPEDSRYDTYVPGFIAEEVAIAYPIAADTDDNGDPNDWNTRLLIPAMVGVLQKINQRLEVLEGKPVTPIPNPVPPAVPVFKPIVDNNESIETPPGPGPDIEDTNNE